MANILAMNDTFLNSKTSYDVSMELANKAKKKRKYMKLMQLQLSQKSAVSLGSLKRFERTGEISFSSMLKIALVLDSLKDFDKVFEKPEYTSIIVNEILKV